jgi:hypothetical protein
VRIASNIVLVNFLRLWVAIKSIVAVIPFMAGAAIGVVIAILLVLPLKVMCRKDCGFLDTLTISGAVVMGLVVVAVDLPWLLITVPPLLLYNFCRGRRCSLVRLPLESLSFTAFAFVNFDEMTDDD